MKWGRKKAGSTFLRGERKKKKKSEEKLPESKLCGKEERDRKEESRKLGARGGRQTTKKEFEGG